MEKEELELNQIYIKMAKDDFERKVLELIFNNKKLDIEELIEKLKEEGYE